MMKAIWRQEKGFTLIELLIVVAIIGILAGIAVPRISQSLDSAKVSACKANQDALESAAELYRFENGSYPSGESWIGALVEGGYLREEPTCPDAAADHSARDYDIDTNGVVTCLVNAAKHN